jgi:kynurenine formamidase
MKRCRIIDLSVPTEESPSEPLGLKVVHQDHKSSVPLMMQFFGCKEEDLPGGMGWANDEVTLISHAGTHVDAPWHYFPTCGGKRARTIDELPLEWFFGPGVVLDFRHKERGSKLTVEDFQQALAKIDYTLRPGDIVLVQTGADKLWGKKEYFDAGCGVGAAATRWLIEQGIKVMGIDAWGWDRPFWAMREEFQRTGDPRVIWEAHRVGMDLEYCQIEKLANLDQLPFPTGFTVACFPVKLTGGSAGWCRAVAIIEEEA